MPKGSIAAGAFAVLLCAWLMPISTSRADTGKSVVDAGKRATALVEISDGNRIKGWASAFCIDRSGIFVTNHHVAVTGAKNNKLTLILDAGTHNQRTLTATVLKVDAETDLAILRADHAGPYESLEISDPAAIRALVETAQVTVFGYPFGEMLSLRDNTRPEPSITMSRVMALRHDKGELQLIQLDGSINHGNSGGPVLDDRGKVIGIISAGIPGSAIAFAIPANRVGRLLLGAGVNASNHAPGDVSAIYDGVLAAGEDASDAPGRSVVPDAAALRDAQKLVHDLLPTEFADTTPKGKRVLAAALLSRAQAISNDPVGCYALLSDAVDTAADCGDLETAMQAASELGRRYEVSAVTIKASALTRLAGKIVGPTDQAKLAAHGILTARGMIHRDMYKDAQQIIPIVRAAATATYSSSVQKQVRENLAWVESACAQYALAEPAINRLKTAPNDPEANLAVGRFQCFAREDFEKGLPLMAKGSDAQLRLAALADLAKPATGPGCKATGDAWWDQAARETKDAVAAEACKARAGYWYRQGVDQLDGLSKTIVQQRLATLPPPKSSQATAAGGSSAVASGPSAGPTTGSPSSPIANPAPVAIDGTWRLNTDQIPAVFDVKGEFSFSDAGLKPDYKCVIITKDKDFLSKDFLFEAHVDVPKESPRDHWVVMGLGDGTVPGSLRLFIRQEGGWGTRAYLCLGDEWGKPFGDIRTPGPRVLRIERRGTAVTVAVGIDNAGKFEPDMTRTVEETKDSVPNLSAHEAHLFFKGVANWSQVTILTGDKAHPAPIASANVPAPQPSAGPTLPATTPPAVSPRSARSVGDDSAQLQGINDFRHWTITEGKWEVASGRFRGDGYARLNFNIPLPMDCTVSCRMKILSKTAGFGFKGISLAFSESKNDKHWRAYGVNVTKGDGFAFEIGKEYEIRFQFAGEKFAIFVDGKSVNSGTRTTVPKSMPFYVRSGDTGIPGSAEFWDFKLDAPERATGPKAAADPAPAASLESLLKSAVWKKSGGTDVITFRPDGSFTCAGGPGYTSGTWRANDATSFSIVWVNGEKSACRITDGDHFFERERDVWTKEIKRDKPETPVPSPPKSGGSIFDIPQSK